MSRKQPSVAERSHAGAPWPVQILLGVLVALMGLFMTMATADEAGVEGSLWWLVLCAIGAALALSVANEWVEKGKPARKLSAPALLAIACVTPVAARAFSHGGAVWLFLGTFAAGLAWAGLACYRMGSTKGR